MMIKGVLLPGRSGTFTVQTEGANIASVVTGDAPATCVIIPALCDAHVHLDKAFTVDRAGQSETGLTGAIDLMAADKACWTEADIASRASHGLRCAYEAGTSALRTHIDWTEQEMPKAWPVLAALARDWSSRILVQRASLTSIDHIFEFSPRIAREVARSQGVLGFFVLLNDDLERRITRAFDLACDLDLDLDFHVDETTDPQAAGLSLIARETAHRNWQGRVLCGHACSLSTQSDAVRQSTLTLCATAGVALVALPTTNSYLQDRMSSRTPRLRGLAPLHEATACGVNVSIASDNCADPFYPYGIFDLLEAFRLGLVIGHLDAAAWTSAITSAPRKAMGLDARTIAAGMPADFIILGAATVREALGNARTTRAVVRSGVVLGKEPVNEIRWAKQTIATPWEGDGQNRVSAEG